MSVVKERDDVLCAENESKLREDMPSAQRETSLIKGMLYWEMSRQKRLSEYEQAVLREEILEEYEEVDYRVSDSANVEHFANLEKKFVILRISDLNHSEEAKSSTYSALRQISSSLRHIQRYLNAQIEYISKHDDWTRLSKCEDEIVNSLIGIIITFLNIKTSCFEQDEELEKISIRTFSHKFLSFLSSPQKSNLLSVKPVRKKHLDTSDFLRCIYYAKSWEDKAEYQKAILEAYLERCKDSNQPRDCNVAAQRQQLKDFQGDLAIIVKEKRKQRKWTQQHLASVSGVERTMIAKVENLQASTSLETAIKLLTPLGMGLVIYPIDSADIISDCKTNQLEKGNLLTETEAIE